ncbi:MAG: radical SAM family heme chaperone HemW [Desulfonatronovibrio sp.]
MLLYIHIPFCLRKCNYCAFFSRPYSRELEQVYLGALKKEIELRSAPVKETVITSIYLGGGTPTVLPAPVLARIIDLVAAGFSLGQGMEFTIEANPETIAGKGHVLALREMGVNRLSLGVQALDDEILTLLGRKHSSSQALKAARTARDAGMDNLSLDLIWGLPGQTLRSWVESLKTLVKLQPRHLSCYGLTVEPGTPLSARVEKNEVRLPADELQARMYIHGAEYLESEGYLQYEVSNFARMGYASAHNTGYWDGKDFLGLGPSAVSSVGGVRWKNPAGIKDYAGLAMSSFQGLAEEEIKGRKFINERIMLSLRTSKGLSLKEYQHLTGESFCRRFDSLINILHQNHLVRVANGYLRLTKNGMLVSNSIIERFIS